MADREEPVARRTTASTPTSTRIGERQRDGTRQHDAEVAPHKVAEMMGLVVREVKGLKEIIVNQSATIKDINDRHARELTALKDQMQEFAIVLTNVREELEEIKAGQVLIANTQTSPQASYADVARTPPTSQPTNAHSQPSEYDPVDLHRYLFCTIDTTRMAAEKIVNDGARVLRNELYPIKVDSVNLTAVLDENGTIRHRAAEAFGQENETTVAKIAWLSKKRCQRHTGDGGLTDHSSGCENVAGRRLLPRRWRVRLYKCLSAKRATLTRKAQRVSSSVCLWWPSPVIQPELPDALPCSL
ncbi:hypothetical protein TruAng_011185 [Truncatella angustata]|nr:hypothetical protein TruAng_011185 [Truncatella angustata]